MGDDARKKFSLVDGKNSLIHTVGKDPAKLVREGSASDGKVAKWTDEDTESLSVSSGRTIGLGNWEFARVNFGVKVGLLYPVEQEHRDAAYERMRNAVEEVLDREEAFIRGEDREFKEIDLNGVGVRVVVWLDYGLTFKKKGQDSNKVDISASRRLTDGTDFESTVNGLGREVGGRIGAYKEMVLGSVEDVGF